MSRIADTKKVKNPNPGYDRKGRPVTRGALRPSERPLLERCLSGSTSSSLLSSRSCDPPAYPYHRSTFRPITGYGSASPFGAASRITSTATATGARRALQVFSRLPRIGEDPDPGSSSDSEPESLFKFRPPTFEQLTEQERVASEHREWLNREFGIPFPRHLRTSRHTHTRQRRISVDDPLNTSPRTDRSLQTHIGDTEGSKAGTMSRASNPNRPNHIPMPPAGMTRASPNGSPGGPGGAPLASPASPRSGFLSGLMSRSRSRANTVTGRNSPRQEQMDPMARAGASVGPVRRDGGGVTRSVSTPIAATEEAPAPRPAPAGPPIDPTGRTHRLRLVPNLENTRSLAFEPVIREMYPIEVTPGLTPSAAAASVSTLGPLVNNRPPALLLKLGRYTDRTSQQNPTEDRPATGIAGPTLAIAGGGGEITNGKVAFKSKVVSRSHAEIWCDPTGKFFIRDTKSSSGTFLNNIRLSSPGHESRPTQINDGDVLQFGVDYQGGLEEMFRCIKMRVELGRDWQRSANEFNTNALRQLKALGGEAPSTSGSTSKNETGTPSRSKKTSVTDCCICLFSVTVCQSLFIAPCSHVFHYKCIRPLLQQHHPGFSCPLCRTFANLEEDVETEDAWEIASRRVSVISRRPSNHSIRLPRDDTRTTAADAPEGAPSSGVGFGAGAASVDELLAGNGGEGGSGSGENSEAGHTAEAGNNTSMEHSVHSETGPGPGLHAGPGEGTGADAGAIARHLSVAANIPIPASIDTSRRTSSEGREQQQEHEHDHDQEPETAMVADLQTPRNEYFLSSFSPMALAQAHGHGHADEEELGEPSMLQRLQLAEPALGADQAGSGSPAQPAAGRFGA